MRLDHLPASVAFCDVETTGLGNYQRIVSFGGIGMISRDLAKGWLHLAYLYLVFDPGMGLCARLSRKKSAACHSNSPSERQFSSRPPAYSPSIAHANRPPVATLKPTSSRLAAG
jgi:hypothetical protein